MDYELVKIILTLVAMATNAAVFLFVWVDRKQMARQAELERFQAKYDAKLTVKCERIAALESRVSALPAREEFEKAQEKSTHQIVRLHERMDEVGKCLQQMQLMIGEIYGRVKGKHEN